MVMPGLVGGFGNYLLPIHCGSPDMANLKLGSLYYKIEAQRNSIENLFPLTKITGPLAQKHPYQNRLEVCLSDSSNSQAIPELKGGIGAKVQDNKYKQINSYLAGLFEGDGHIWLPKLNMKKKHNPRFCITFGLKNEPLAKKILEIIEYGHIKYKPKENACVLIVSPVKGLKKIITLINGELRTPKIHQLHKLID
jgi:hypothetical protein